MSRKPFTTIDDTEGLLGPYDGAQTEDLWFLPEDEAEDGPLPRSSRARLINGDTWRLAEAALTGELAELIFDAGRLAERLRTAGAGAVQRLALEEAAAQSWWTGDRIGSDRLALWLSYRIGAAEEGGEGLIRTAWAARRLMAKPSGGIAALVADFLGVTGRGDPAFPGEVAEVLEDVTGLAAVTRGRAAFHLWRSLEVRPDHLRGLEAAVLGARLAGQGGLAFLPLALERLAPWLTLAEVETADLPGRTPAWLIAALAGQAVRPCSATRISCRRAVWCARSRGRAGSGSGPQSFRASDTPARLLLLLASALKPGAVVAGRQAAEPTEGAGEIGRIVVTQGKAHFLHPHPCVGQKTARLAQADRLDQRVGGQTGCLQAHPAQVAFGHRKRPGIVGKRPVLIKVAADQGLEGGDARVACRDFGSRGGRDFGHGCAKRHRRGAQAQRPKCAAAGVIGGQGGEDGVQPVRGRCDEGPA